MEIEEVWKSLNIYRNIQQGLLIYSRQYIQCLLLAHAQELSCVHVFVTSWILTYQAPLSIGFPRQKYWSGLPFPPPGDLPDPKIKPTSPAAPAGGFFITEPPGKAPGVNAKTFCICPTESCPTLVKRCP